MKHNDVKAAALEAMSKESTPEGRAKAYLRVQAKALRERHVAHGHHLPENVSKDNDHELAQHESSIDSIAHAIANGVAQQAGSPA